MMIWLFGRPASGKTTLANFIVKKLDNAIILDGDILRKSISKDLGFSVQDRFEHIKRTLSLAKKHQSKKKNVIVALITPMERFREYIQLESRETILIYVKCNLEVCQQRDPKGLYQKAKVNEIQNFTGLTQPFESPRCVDLIIDTNIHNIEKSGQMILDFLKK